MLKRIVVLVSGGGTNLQALIDAQARDELGAGEIVQVISSNPDAYAIKRAEKAGIVRSSPAAFIRRVRTTMRQSLRRSSALMRIWLCWPDSCTSLGARS